MAAKAIPDGFNSVSAYLVVKDPDKAIEFYGKAFGAEPGAIMRMPDGKSVMHGEVCIGNSTVMLTGAPLSGAPVAGSVAVTSKGARAPVCPSAVSR